MDTTHIVLTPSSNLLPTIILSSSVFSHIPHMLYSHVTLAFLDCSPMHGSFRSHRHHKTILQSRKIIYCCITIKLGQLLSNLQPSDQPFKRQKSIHLIITLSHSQALS